MATQIIYIAGDVHGRWDILNQYINKKIRQGRVFLKQIAKLEENSQDVEVIILQCGDFGIWIPEDIGTLPIKNKVDFLKDGHVKIYFADGNHENHDVLDKLEKDNPNNVFPEVAPYVYFATFSSVLTLLDGTNILFAGGAESADKSRRTPNETWWEQEGIDDQDMLRLPPPNSNIDWVISHAAPLSFELGRHVIFYRPEKLFEPSRHYLEEILQTYCPKQWFFGHYHYSDKGKKADCAWKCLNYSHAINLNTWIIQEKVIKI